MGGHIDTLFISLGQMAQPWQAGQVRALAVGSRPRVAEFPAIAHGGRERACRISRPHPGSGSWPRAGRRPTIVAKINADVQRILSDASFKEKFLVPNRYEPIIGSPEQFGEFMKADTLKWMKVITDANVKVE